MAQVMMDPVVVISFPASDRTAAPKSSSSLSTGVLTLFGSIDTIEAALLDAGDTQKILDTLTLNDKIYRLRLLIEDGTVTPANILPAVVIDAANDPVDEVEPWGTVWINTGTTPDGVFQSDGAGNWVEHQ